MFIITKMLMAICKWWSDISSKTRLMALTTLIISLIISSVTFWTLTIVQEDSIITDTRFCKDLGILFVSNVVNLAASNNQAELTSFIEKIYLSTSSIRYILFFRSDGSLLMGLPVYNNKVQGVLQLHQNLLQLETQDFLFDTPLVTYNTFLTDHITDIIIPVTKNGKNLGSLDLGINSNPTLLSSSRLVRDISMTIFVSIWLMVVIGVTFSTLTITEPIKQLLLGINNIALGNFNQRINLSFDGELGDLIISFNEMAEKLEFYDKRNIETLTSEKQKLETIVSVIAEGAILVDTDLRILFVNQMALKVFNWVNLDVIGRPIFRCMPLHVGEALLPVLNNLVKSIYLDNLSVQTQEICIDLAYDTKKVFRFLLTPVSDSNTNVLKGVAIVMHDISREVILNDAKNQFISNVSHELRTPLCNIGSFLETLLDYNSSLADYEKIQFLTIANNETKRLSSLVNDILDLSRLELEYKYELSRVNLIKIINNVIIASQLITSYNNINLILEVHSEVEFVFANENSLQQVLENLISNAIKFSSIQGKIILRVYLLDYYRIDNIQKKANNYIRVEVIDEGIGINEVNQKYIFDRFMRIENSIHTLEGTGLGLSIVKNILLKHHTDIKIQSQLFVGTSLWFDLIGMD